MEAFTCDFEHHQHAARLLREHGVVVVTGVFAPQECNAHVHKLKEDVSTVLPEVKDEWTDANAPPGPRSEIGRAHV